MDKETNEYIMTGTQANVKSLLIMIPLALFLVTAYTLVWGWDKAASDMPFLFSDFKLLVSSLIAGTVLHELLHALGWSLASGLPLSTMSFGFNWKAVAPYAHCNVAMSAKAYRRGAVAPGLILGILPYCAGLIFGNGFLTGFGFLFTLVAGGDFLMLWLIRNVEDEQLVQDHPTKVGCIVNNNIEQIAN